MKPRWTECEREFVCAHYGRDMTGAAISAALNRTPASVSGQARQLGLQRPRRNTGLGLPVACEGGRQGPIHARVKAEVVGAIRREFGGAVQGYRGEVHSPATGRVLDLLFFCEDGLLPVEVGDTKEEQLADIVREFGLVVVCPYLPEDGCGKA